MIVRYWFTSQYPSDEMISYYQGDSKGSTHFQGRRGGGEEEERRVEGGLVFAPTESHIHKQRLFPAQSAQYSVCR